MLGNICDVGAMEMLWSSAPDSSPIPAPGALSPWDLLGLLWEGRGPYEDSCGTPGSSGHTVLTGFLKGLCGMGSFLGGTWLFHSISHKPHSYSQLDPNCFDRDWLFSVVARGVPEDLVGLPEYLRRTTKYLTDTEYTGRPALRPEPLSAHCAETVRAGWALTMVRRPGDKGQVFSLSYLFT